ncbi:MAG: methylmalonyl Co-A mutase-associated GTPase MeaB, partial [Verrucomicrobiota bacterium]
RAEATRLEFERVMQFLSPATEGWKPPVLAASSVTRSGVAEVWRATDKYFEHVEADGDFDLRRREQAISWWQALVEQELRVRFLSDPHVAALSARLESEILSGQLAPSLAAEELLGGAGLPTL